MQKHFEDCPERSNFADHPTDDCEQILDNPKRILMLLSSEDVGIIKAHIDGLIEQSGVCMDVRAFDSHHQTLLEIIGLAWRRFEDDGEYHIYVAADFVKKVAPVIDEVTSSKDYKREHAVLSSLDMPHREFAEQEFVDAGLSGGVIIPNGDQEGFESFLRQIGHEKDIREICFDLWFFAIQASFSCRHQNSK